jgi:hypothetical protein
MLTELLLHEVQFLAKHGEQVYSPPIQHSLDILAEGRNNEHRNKVNGGTIKEFRELLGKYQNDEEQIIVYPLN